MTPQYAATRICLPGTPQEHLAPWVPPVYGSSTERTYTVTQSDVGRADTIAERVWERSDLWWVILHYNGVLSAFALQPGDQLLIPALEVVEAALLRMPSRRIASNDADDASVSALPLLVPSPVQPLTALLPQAEDVRLPVALGGYVIFDVPAAAGAHYQVHISLDQAFETIYVGHITMISASGWSYWNGTAWAAFPSGAGGLTYGQTRIRLSVASLNIPRAYVRWRMWVSELEQPWQNL